MRMMLFSSRPYDVESFRSAQAEGAQAGFGAIELAFNEFRLDERTAKLAEGVQVVCPFVNDGVNAAVIERLAAGGTRLLALRSAGYNHVDVAAAARAGIVVVRVPAYSPYAVAEHAVGMILTLNRRLHRANNRTREGDFSLNGLLGFDLHGKTVGVVGTGTIGRVFARIMASFGTTVLAYDPFEHPEIAALGGRYVSLDTLLASADIVSLHCPLMPSTRHLIRESSLASMKPGAMLINTSRGGLVDSLAVIDALKSGQLGHLGLDVYEEEGPLYFEDHSDELLLDDVLARLLTFPNVLITAHQAFFTREALAQIAATTLSNALAWQRGAPCNVVEPDA
ncbi:2-hydroxyacid dehydrogenase [Pararobbsia silviterrae]|uniref:2-hydroxyacid dehydrogenase n=1 Tax=Pararobbsia silviterrae TaxID=1792498 RepID=A0A494Y894_9BURK|nr:2-hydroxyacid dehydrogenase [Pararobbsia silviterrae]RKP56526.1 2-hydroxyacid dehydrogenase [Pararobbsia silviterrae]